LGRADIYLQPDAEDPVLTPATVLGLAREHAGRAEAVTGVDESGGEARAYLVDERLVVKTQRPHRLRPRTSLAKEARLLSYLADGPLAGQVPALFGYSSTQTDQGSVEYLVMSRMPGRPARHASVTGPARTVLLHTLGRLLRALHAQPAGPLAATGLFPADDSAGALRQRLELGLADLGDEIAGRPGCWQLTVSPEDAAGRAVSALPEVFAAPVPLHSNPGPAHTFVDAGGALTGLIDFGDSYLSHPALDLHRWPAVADRLALREGYLDGQAPPGGFDAVWNAGMIYADMKAITGPAELAAPAGEDLARRLAFR
jgi:aminoglycoside phosphotransferase (APT) family kinase protein